MMRPLLILCLTTAGLLGACASSRSNTAATDACTQRCAAASSSPLERSTCELDCSRLAAATTPPTSSSPPPQPQPPQPQPQPPPQPQPLPPQPPAPQPVPPQQPQPQPQPPQPQPQPIGPATTHYTLPPGGGAPVPTYAHPPGTQTSPQGAPQPATVDRRAIAECESACIRENSSSTDQATCKLNCNAVGTVYAPAPSYNVYSGTPPSDADARAAVIRSSGGVVQGGSQPAQPQPQPQPRPPASQPTPAKVAQCTAEAQQCSSACTTQLEPCNRGCSEGKMSNTDRATCRLTCESTADLCRDDCRMKEGNCRNKP